MPTSQKMSSMPFVVVWMFGQQDYCNRCIDNVFSIPLQCCSFVCGIWLMMWTASLQPSHLNNNIWSTSPSTISVVASQGYKVHLNTSHIPSNTRLQSPSNDIDIIDPKYYLILFITSILMLFSVYNDINPRHVYFGIWQLPKQSYIYHVSENPHNSINILYCLVWIQ